MSTGGNNGDWLTQLAPERAPLVPAWWPPAPGWWCVAVLLLAALAGLLWWWRWPPRRLRRVAMRELRRIRRRDADVIETARAVQNLLRRYALAVFGADRVARLNGAEWLEFVATHGAGSLGGPLGEAMLAASFGGRIPAGQVPDRDAWCAAAESFLRHAAQDPQRSKPA